MMPLAKPHIAAMAPYALATLEVPEGRRLVSMAQNESLRPPSPQVSKAIENALQGVQLYPDPDWFDLRREIARVHHLDADLILCGAGSMELIGCLAHAFLGPGAGVVTSQYAYAFIATAAAFTNASITHVPEKQFFVDVDALVDAVGNDTRMVFVANPGNPTGTRIPDHEVRRLRERLPVDVILVVDEAYGEFCDADDDRVFDLAGCSNTVVLRTFSKAYGLAGMRVGWGYFPSDIAGQTRKLLNPNNIPACSQAAATAAMTDQAYMKATCRITAEIRQEFTDAMTRAGIRVVPSHTNFLLLELEDPNSAKSANAVLVDAGFVMRGMGSYGLPQCLRATVCERDDMRMASEILTRWRKGK